jgi:hypothetical protein
MKIIAHVTALLFACCLFVSNAAFAKGSGGGHGSAGHGSGGHTSGGHGRGHAGSSHGSTAAHGTAVARRARSTAAAGATGSATSKPSSGRKPDEGQPAVGAAGPRADAASPFTVRPSSTYLPSRVLPCCSSARVGGGLAPFDNPLWFGAQGTPRPMHFDGAIFGYPSYPFDPLGLTGSLRLQMRPGDAEVYVDGYYAGIVDDFGGHFQHLDLTPGPHHIEIRAPGRLSLAFDVAIEADHKINYRGTLLRTPR